MYQLEYDSEKAKRLGIFEPKSFKDDNGKAHFSHTKNPEEDLKKRGYENFELSEPDELGIIIVTVYDEKMRIDLPFPKHYWPCQHSETSPA